MVTCTHIESRNLLVPAYAWSNSLPMGGKAFDPAQALGGGVDR